MYDIALMSVNLSGFRGRQSRYGSPPQGILRLTAALEAYGYRVECHDYQTADVDDPMDVENLAAFLETDAPVLGVGCTSDTLPLVIAATRCFKTRHPSTRLILGGHGPTEVADALLATFPHVDVVVRGEGEETMLELMRRGAGRLDDVPGLSYRREDMVKANPARPRLRNLDKLPAPAYHHVDWDRYERVDVETARGCPYHCTFCSASPFFLGRYVSRSLDRVMAELQLLARSYGMREVWFSDDTFIVHRHRVMDMCQRLHAADLGIEWGCYARVDLMDQELMESMAGAGCSRLFYGIESGSNNILHQIGKRTTIEQAEEVLCLSTRYFSKLRLGFIWGLPFESMADFEETLKAAARFAGLGPQIEIELSLWAPFPSSPLYAQWAGLKEFSPSFLPMIGHCLPGNYGTSKTWHEIVALIRAYPEVFAALHHVPESGLNRKREILEGRAWLADALVGLAAANEDLAMRLKASPEAGLRYLGLEVSPANLWATAEASARLEGQARASDSISERG